MQQQAQEGELLLLQEMSTLAVSAFQQASAELGCWRAAQHSKTTPTRTGAPPSQVQF
jgi:hypothetical protein